MRKVALILLALVIFLGALSWWCMPNHSINRESAARIQKGMAESEVVGILRVEPGHYLTISLPEAKRSTKMNWLKAMSSIDRRLETKHWVADEGEIVVSFDDNGKVAGVVYLSHDLGIFEFVLLRLGLR